MKRLDATFARLRAEGRTALVGFLTAGDPDLERSERDIRAAIAGGIDILELGVPFSDPTADGPVIQAASFRALASGMTLGKTLALVARLRADTDIPIVLFGYANPLFRRGYARVCSEAAAAGVDAFLVVDLPPEESAEFEPQVRAAGMDFIPLIAPTTPEPRARAILEHAGGFVYYVMVTGVTGARADVAQDVAENVRSLRGCTKLPICVGFGVSDGKTARRAAAGVDGVVVGSALVQAAREDRLPALVLEIRAALDA